MSSRHPPRLQPQFRVVASDPSSPWQTDEFLQPGERTETPDAFTIVVR